MRHGFLKTHIILNRHLCGLKTFLKLRNQCYICQHFRTFTLKTPLVNCHDLISNLLKLALSFDAIQKRSENDEILLKKVEYTKCVEKARGCIET